MQDEKEKFDLETHRLLFLGYILSSFVFLFGFYLLFKVNGLFKTDTDSARYMLSALVQSQAAILAIVISITLIAVQLAASAYSPRVIDIFKNFKKNPFFWLLLVFYGLSIFYGLFLLKMVKGVKGEFVSNSAIWSFYDFSLSFELCVSFAYWFGILMFLTLIPYIWYTMDILKPKSIIKQLAININKDNLLSSEENPIQPIVDIVHDAIMKYDIDTTRVGLSAVTDRIIKTIDLTRETMISMYFCKHLKRLFKGALSKMDEEAIISSS